MYNYSIPILICFTLILIPIIYTTVRIRWILSNNLYMISHLLPFIGKIIYHEIFRPKNLRYNQYSHFLHTILLTIPT